MSQRLVFPNSAPLKIHEKLVALFFVGFIFVLIQYALRVPEERWPKSHYQNTPEKLIVVEFSGEVAEPGRYHFLQGTTLNAALNTISLNNEASLKGLKLDLPLKKGQKIKVKKEKK